MLTIFGFSWLIYSIIHSVANNELDFISSFDFSDVLQPITDYLNDSNNLLTYLTGIGNGIRNIYLNMPGLILYFVMVCMIVTIIAFFIRLVIDII